MRISASIILLTVGLLSNVIAQQITVGDVYPNDLEIKAFSLSSDQDVHIEGTGGVFKDDYRILIYYGWILNAKTRKVAWHLFDEFKGYDRFRERDGMYDFSLDIPLEAGDYELYFVGAHDNRNWNGEWSLNTFEELLDEIFDSRDRSKFQRSMQDDLFIKVEADGLKEADVDDFFRNAIKDSKVYFGRAKDEEKFEQGFNLTDDTRIRVYALGEGRKDDTFDYGIIMNAVTRETVFEMNYRNTSFAGGADKNLKVNEVITLPKGSYLVSYSTDDSHSYERWNALPPDDPQFWGITLTPETKEDAKNFAPYNPPGFVNPVIELTNVRNNTMEAIGFTLSKDMDVRVLCLGEGDYDEMHDYGWIVDANTRKTVWKMNGYRTNHAGGASKNRKFEGIVNLDKGDYIAYYVTDGSHAYDSWNASRPAEEERWGLTLWATNTEDINAIKDFNPNEYVAKNLIAEIVMVGDDAYEKKTFELDKTTDVTIIAVGEGQDRRMFDYGWIKNMDTGDIIWEMNYYDTEHAGGAKKNRMAIEKLTLPKGEYRMYYESDGSHSFQHWNSDPPHDPNAWGIRVMRVE